MRSRSSNRPSGIGQSTMRDACDASTQIHGPFKIKGSVAHDLCALPKGHALRNVSDYAWYNSNCWVDLFPKLALRVLRNVKFTGDTDFLKQNWRTLKFGF